MSDAFRTNSSAAVVLLHRNAGKNRPALIPPRLAVHVLDGMHAGSIVQIAAGRLVVGAADECDIVLYDDGIEERHATLNVKRCLLGDMLEIQTASSDVTVAGRPIRGTGTEMLPAVLTMGGVALRFERSNHGAALKPNTKAPWIDRIINVSAVSAMLCAAVILARLGLGEGDEAINLVPRLGLDVAAAPAGPAPDARIEALQDQIDTTGLGEFLTLAPMADATVAVRGTLPEHMAATWDDVHEWYDMLDDPPLLASQFSRAPSLSGLPAIAMVRISGVPEILFVGGRRAVVGDRIADGWTLDEIGVDGLHLSRGGESVGVDY